MTTGHDAAVATVTFEHGDDSVAVVVGSGAGGGTLANELAQKGIDVVVLEAGPRLEMSDFVNDELGALEQLSWLDPRTCSGDAAFVRHAPTFPTWICKTVGGSTVHWVGNSIRLQAREFRPRTEYGEVPGANLIDWPIALEEMLPYYERAEDKMGVTGRHGIPRLPKSNNSKVFFLGAKRMGFEKVSTSYLAINAEPRDGRNACDQIGFCMQGCKSGAKWSTLYTEIPRAEATGHCEVRANSTALQIDHDDAGRVTGVLYADAAGNRHFQKARVVCMAGNSIETPRIFFNSNTSKFPDGLANSSGQLGKNYMRNCHGGIRRVRQAGAHEPRRGRRRPGRGPWRQRSRGPRFPGRYLDWRGAGWRAFFRRDARSQRMGAGAKPHRSRSTTTWPGLGSAATTCRRSATR